MNFALLAAYSFGVVTLLLIPGLVVALIITAAPQHGYRRAFLTLIDTNDASLVLTALAALMLAGVVSISATWLGVLGPVGSPYIGVMAINGLQARDLSPGLCAPKRDSSGPIHGFLTGVASPKDILFSVALFPQFIAIMQDFTTSILMLMLVWVISDATVLSLYIVVFKRRMLERFAGRSIFISSLFLPVVAAFGIIHNIHALQMSSPAMRSPTNCSARRLILYREE